MKALMAALAVFGLAAFGTPLIVAQTIPQQPIPREELSAKLTPEEFIQRAAREAMGDAEIGRMVRSDVTLPNELQSLGNDVAARATEATEQLRRMAERHDVALTGQLTAEDSASIQDLSRVQGNQFTEIYLERMTSTLDRHIRLHERALEIDAPDIRQYAEKMLPTLRDQLAAARAIQDEELADQQNSQ